ncbi:GerAB/ArcD/ProY family transporter [Ornithinibacillus californiensis]|uniref:GerAB/ArcD/ProY family transporter n=1 Tax=Ornithinibacillus californiensis TaxID=161536 RepID=UPI00069D240F|nr:endospore germination permease [Ornithinibacillus californiensis]
MMIEKGRISTGQMELLIIPTIISTAILSISSIDARLAGHDMWMTPILGSSAGFLTVYIVWKLHELYPGQTPIGYSQKLIGKVAGSLFGLLLILFFSHNTGIIIREYTGFIKSNVLLQTPSIVISLSLLLVAALAVRGGLEVIARTAVICTFLFLSTSIVLLLLIPEVELGNVLPTFENGFIPVLKGAFIHQSWFSEFFILAFIFPFLNNTKKGLKSGFRAILVVMFILCYVNFFVLTTIGVVAGDLYYPVYAIVKSISLAEFFENFEILITASWVLGNFVKIAMFLYAASLALAELFRINDYRVMVLPLSLFIFFFSYWDISNVVELVNYMGQIQPFYLISVQTVIPLFLLLIALLKKKRSDNN